MSFALVIDDYFWWCLNLVLNCPISGTNCPLSCGQEAGSRQIGIGKNTSKVHTSSYTSIGSGKNRFVTIWQKSSGGGFTV